MSIKLLCIVGRINWREIERHLYAQICWAEGELAHVLSRAIIHFFLLSFRPLFYIIWIEYLPDVTDHLQVTYKRHNLLCHKLCYVNTYFQKRQAWDKECRKLVTTRTFSVVFLIERKLFSCATVFSMPFVCKCIGYIYIHTYICIFRELIRDL